MFVWRPVTVTVATKRVTSNTDWTTWHTFRNSCWSKDYKPVHLTDSPLFYTTPHISNTVNTDISVSDNSEGGTVGKILNELHLYGSAN